MDKHYYIGYCPGHRVYEGRYWNANFYAVVIVATVTLGRDWAAYIGSAGSGVRGVEALMEVAEKGCKMSEEDAKYYFPYIADVLPYRR